MKLIYSLVLVLLFANVVNAAYMDYDDNWAVNGGTTDDGFTWGSYSLDVGMNDVPSTVDMICWDFDGDTYISKCIFRTGRPSNYCDNGWIQNESGIYVRPSNLSGGNCGFTNENCENAIGTSVSGDAWNITVNAWMVSNCSTGFPSQQFTKDYHVVNGQEFKCSGSSNYNYNGGVGSVWHTIKTTSCGTGYSCASNHNSQSSSATATLSSPCRIANDYSCSLNTDCASDFCVHGTCRSSNPYCGDGYCDTAENCAADNGYCSSGYQCTNGCQATANCPDYNGDGLHTSKDTEVGIINYFSMPGNTALTVTRTDLLYCIQHYP